MTEIRTHVPRTIAVTSGKGGVGKTNFTLNLATLWGAAGKRVLIFDADLALANIHMLLGISPVVTMNDFLLGRTRLEEVRLRASPGVDLLPGGNAEPDSLDIPPATQAVLIDQVAAFALDYDIFLIDTASGLTGNVLRFASASDRTLLVTTPEPTALSDAYAVMKMLLRTCGEIEIQVAVNMACDMSAGRRAGQGLVTAARRFLGREIDLAGEVGFDPYVRSAVRRQDPFVALYPRSRAARQMAALANRIDGGFAVRESDLSRWSRRIARFIFPAGPGTVKGGPERG